MDVNEMVKTIKSNGYAVFPEWLPYQNKWEIVVCPWDYITGKKRIGKVKRTGHFFQKNDCVSRDGKETEFEKKMKEVQMKLVEHFTNKKTANV